MLNWQNIYIEKRANSRFFEAKFVSVVVIESVSFISVNLNLLTDAVLPVYLSPSAVNHYIELLQIAVISGKGNSWEPTWQPSWPGDTIVYGTILTPTFSDKSQT